MSKVTLAGLENVMCILMFYSQTCKCIKQTVTTKAPKLISLSYYSYSYCKL